MGGSGETDAAHGDDRLLDELTSTKFDQEREWR
jgi:hypothetical protein